VRPAATLPAHDLVTLPAQASVTVVGMAPVPDASAGFADEPSMTIS